MGCDETCAVGCIKLVRQLCKICYYGEGYHCCFCPFKNSVVTLAYDYSPQSQFVRLTESAGSDPLYGYFPLSHFTCATLESLFGNNVNLEARFPI